MLTATLTASDITNAELLWIKLSQKMLIHNDRFDVWRHQLDLFCDEDGTWKCRGRLQNIDITESRKHPTPLDKAHHFTNLIVRDSHARVMHNGEKDTLTELQ